MLQLFVTDIDIGRISEILSRYRLKSTVTCTKIIIDTDEITEDVVEMLFANATIVGVKNYQDEDSGRGDYVKTKFENEDGPTITSAVEESELNHVSEENAEGGIATYIPYDTDGKSDESSIETRCYANENMLVKETTYSIEPENDDSEYSVEEPDKDLEDLGIEFEQQRFGARNKDLKFKKVFRGEVYQWGPIIEDDDGEGIIKECVIIIQNDYLKSPSEDTIAILCTSHYDERAPINFSFQFTQATMIDYSAKRLNLFTHCTFFVGRIMGISRKYLGKYLGTMNYTFMNTLQPTIDFCLGLQRSRTVNWVQLKILSTVNMKELFNISESEISDERKVEEILKLFGFDMSFNGVEHVKEAILIASKLGDYKLAYLAETIAKRHDLNANEVLMLIVARIKEKFHFKKSPAISFIRLIDSLVRKG